MGAELTLNEGLEVDHAAEKALHHIGTNALPYLVKWLRYEPPGWKTKVYDLVNPIARRLNASWNLNDDRERIRALGAFVAFTSMGTNARPAMPFLRQLLNDSSPVIRICASNLVHEIDPAAVEKAGKKGERAVKNEGGTFRPYGALSFLGWGFTIDIALLRSSVPGNR